MISDEPERATMGHPVKPGDRSAGSVAAQPFEVVSPWRDLDDRILLFDRAAQRHVELRGGAVHVHRLLANRLTESQVIAEMGRLFPDHPEARDEAQALIVELLERGLLVRGDG